MENGLNKRSKLSDILCVLPAFIFILSILLVRLHLFSMPMTNIYWSEATDESTLSDLFNYWKAMAIIGAACFAVVVFVVAYFKDSIHFKKSFLYIPALVYVTFVLLSYVFSNYKYFALRGMSEHFEGTIVLLAYILMVFFLANVVDSERRLKAVVYCALGVALLLGILGVTQATGHDFFSTAMGQKMMTPNYTLDTGIKSWDMIDILAASGQKAYDFSFTEGEVYQTVYNINYVPLYLSLLIPVSAIAFVYFSMRDKKSKIGFSILFIITFGLFLYNFFAANSASGFFGLATLFIALLFVARKYLRLWIKPIICLVVVLGLVAGLMADRWLPDLKGLIGSAIDSITSFVYADGSDNLQTDYENAPASVWIPIDYIETADDQIRFGINSETLLVTRDNETSSFVITDGNGDQLYMTTIDGEDGFYQILDDRFHDYVKLSLEKDANYSIIQIRTYPFPWRFCYTENGFYYRNSMGKLTSMEKIPHAGLFNDYFWATSRGRIWDTTIPMLKSYIVKGAGADTFAFVFPQNDYTTFYNMQVSNSQTTVTDKAHNLYMQYWVNTGLISLLAWLTMVGYYLVGAVKQFRKRGFVDFCDFVNGGIFCGICGFLAVAFFNDGSVNTMPMFYTMLGTGLAINVRDKWPSDEPVGETSGSDGADPGEGKKKGKKAKTAAEVMPEM